MALNEATNADTIDPWWSQQERHKDLEAFSVFFTALLEKATLLEPFEQNDPACKKKEYRERMTETALLIRGWSKDSKIPDEIYFPNELAGEKDAVQPILYSILWALATMGDFPTCQDIHKERRYPQLNPQDTRRQIDFEAGEPPVWTQNALPVTSTQPPIEAKNIAEENKTLKKCMGRGRNNASATVTNESWLLLISVTLVLMDPRLQSF